ncbi:hypothetical protein [Peptostreptococcus stomatis]|uniref:hypothetical protein n=1 Tax=Peptostreptococcus stomatis TaxID=341694 RepID=UPI000309A542|nr:hypothetical protein [Peptostreptococcus stomatis]
MKKFANIIGVILSLILPALALLYFAGLYEIFLYNWLWCGLYGCILVCVFCRSKIYKAVAIILNFSVILLCAFGSLMGGISGPLIVLLHMVIPFYSAWV